MKLLIITGMSGAGKSLVANDLEDMGYYCVDNIPPAIIPAFVSLSEMGNEELSRIAVVTDIRGGEMFSEILSTLKKLAQNNVDYKILFLDASDEVLVNRYRENRRKHPLCNEKTSLVEAVSVERKALLSIREKADLGEATWADYIKNYEERSKIAMESYAKNRDEYIAQTKQGMDDATAAFSDYIKVFEEGNDEVKAAVSEINSMAKEISSALGQTAGIIRSANAAIASNSRGVGVGDFTPYQGNLANGNTPTEVNKAKTVGRGKVRGNAINIMTKLSYGVVSPLFGTLMDTFFNENKGNIKDGVIDSNNNPIMAQADKITKIQDGMSSFVQSDPKDTALFAKDGGPFDTLFNGVFSKINSLYDAYSGHRSASFNTNNDAFKVEINGRLELSSGGQSVNIINEIQNNPLLIRALSRMLSEQLSKAFNGGRGTSPIAIGNV